MTSESIKLGLCIMYPAAGVVERIGKDWDWVWLDGQHGQLSGYDQMLAMVRACNYVNTPAYVRVAGHEASGIGLALDMGADAIIIPQVDTVEQAQQLVRAAKFPPLGNRSFGGRRPIDIGGREYCESANTQTKLICQIESPEALEAVDAIAAVPGVDGLFIGPDDLVLRWGGSMTQASDKTKLGDAITRVAAACRKHGKDCLCVGIGKEMTKFCAERGVNYIVAGGDVAFIAGGSKEALLASREALASSSIPAVGVGKQAGGLY